MSEQPEFEELEHIPWSALAVKTSDPLFRLAYVAAGVVAAIVLGLLAARWLLAGDGPTVVTLPPAAVAASPAGVEAGAAATVGTSLDPGVGTTTPPESVISQPALYSEADLMAIAVDDESRLAMFHAEWFVRDYFTADGDEAIIRSNSDLVQEEWPPTRPTVSSYVEWTRAYAVLTPRPGRYRVEVAYRLLMGSNGDFTREPVAAAAVELIVDVDGMTRLAQLPEPIDPPALLGLDRPEYLADYPEEVVSEAVERLSRFGLVDLVGVYAVDGGWHVAAAVESASGLSRPLLVVIED